VDAHGFGISPGETAALGNANGRAVLMLPGRLDAALAAFLIVGVPLIARLAGRSIAPVFASVKLAKKISSSPGLAEMIPVRRLADGIEPLASGTLPAAALAAADGWVLVPPQSEGFAAGSIVELRPLP
jgi:molybdopterin biosynthesis enzyme